MVSRVCVLGWLSLVAGGLVDPRDADWIHAPMRARDIAEGRRPRAAAALLSEGTEFEQSTGAAKILHEMGAVESKVAALMRGHPNELRNEEKLLHEASEAALHAGESRALSKSIMAKERESREHLATLLQSNKAKKMSSHSSESAHASVESAVKAEQGMLFHYASGMSKLAVADRRILSETSKAKEMAIEALSGKDAKVGAEVAQLLSQAQGEEKKVLKSEMKQARMARHKAKKVTKDVTSELQEMKHMDEAEAMSRTAIRQKEVSEALSVHRKFAAGEAKLAKEGKHMLSDFAELKDAVANAMAGGSSKDIKTAMEVGSLLDQASNQQQDVTKLEEKQVKETKAEEHELVKEKVHLMKEAKAPKHVTHALLQQEEQAQAESLANEDQRMVVKAARRAAHQARQEHKLLSETIKAEDAIKNSLRGRDAAKVRALVMRMMEKAKHMEKGALASQVKLAKKEWRAAKHLVQA